MPDDILTAAQQAINDAAKHVEPVSDALPQEPAPIPVTDTNPIEVAPPPLTPPPKPAPTGVAPPTQEAKEQLMNDLLDTPTTVSSVPPMVPPAPIHKPKKQSNGGVLALVAALLLTLPVAVYYISQQNQQIADTRSSAYGGQQCDPSQGQNGGCGANEGCSCRNGSCTCGPNGGQNNCYHTICPNNYHCVGSGSSAYCSPDTGDDNGDDDTGDDTTVTPVCQNIKIYKNGTQVTPSSLVAGDVVVLAVKGNLTPDKAHFRINGGAWSETTTKNSSDEFTSSYTVPTGVSDFVIEGEVFTTGAWR